ncbi:unnamed protein product [Echinostoma caproni]|uniref:RNB domain-containing protein n=1 Tax=Echinostoma caproni TaxID=27848 RepID=A0A3P8EYZ1_9TREM|nr:unnamed protein product [Echinostoma caproni]
MIGTELTKKIADDLESSADPPELSSSATPWWSVIQRTARVVGIIHALNPRACMGRLVLPIRKKSDQTNDSTANDVNNTPTANSSNWSFANLVHSDTRVPRILIPRSACPEAFKRHPESYAVTQFVARITDWPDTSLLPRGELLRNLSTDSSKLLETETERILVNTGFTLGLNNVNYFPDSVVQSVQSAVVAAEANLSREIALRRDLRSQCTITIDPSTARDLDDALHCRILGKDEREKLTTQGYPDAFYEVGIHIADVSYFVRSDSAVDLEAAQRSTTIYLVQLCVPMLPRLLCEQLCSLNVGEDKLAFSAIFTVSQEGEYMIDHPDACDPECAPSVEAPHTVKSVSNMVLMLHELATHRRKRRFAGGSLRLDTVKLRFTLDDDNQHPVGVNPYIHMPSNWLVEEWMLAANEAVAVHLAQNLPQTAFLRRHPAPSLKQLNDVATLLESVGISVDTGTAGCIQASICRIAGRPLETGFRYSPQLAALCAEMSTEPFLLELEVADRLETMNLNDSHSDQNIPNNPTYEERKDKLKFEARLLLLVSLLTKSMNLAEYFCLGKLPNGITTNHYALNMQYYTHFTSPIRRYADVLVHRQLAAVLARTALQSGDHQTAKWYSETAMNDEVKPTDLQKQAEVCNSKKLSARLAGEDSAELFFTLFVMETGPLTEVCSVIGVLDHSFTVLLLSSGLTRRVYLNKLNLKSSQFVPSLRTGGRVSGSAKLCLLWNWDDSSALTNEQTKGPEDVVDTGETTKPPCDCFYMEIKFCDMVRCRVYTESTNSGDANDSKGNDISNSNETLPKMIKFMATPSALVSSEEAERFMKEGLAFQGQVRVISPSLAFVEHPVDKKRVVLFGRDRSQALHGDTVVVRLYPMGLWKVSGTCPSRDMDKSLSEGETTSSTALAEFPDSDSTASAEDTLDLDFSEAGSTRPPSAEDFYRLPSKFRDLFMYRTLDELTFDPNCSWPLDLPWNLNLSSPPMVWAPLPSQSLIRTGQVISIARKDPRSRRLIGQIAFFRPHVGRITRKTVPLPSDAPTDSAICLFVPNSTHHALVKLDPRSIPKVLCEQLGDMNELEPATQKILIEYGIEEKEFRPEHIQGLPEHPDHFIIPPAEYTYRKDFRSRCVFTIDPPSAKDIDDALHIERLKDGLYEVGIHIADVSYFVKPGTPLDLEAAERTTSVYLVQRITNAWFGRSIIRSCAKLSYDQALLLLKASGDGVSGMDWKTLRTLVPEPERPFSYDQLQRSLVWLNRIAQNLRKKRLENGALTLQKAKIEFDLPFTLFNQHPEPAVDCSQSEESSSTSTTANRTIWPRGYSIETPGPANHLIEEWMLAANQAVARRLFDEFWKQRFTKQYRVRRAIQSTFLNENKWPGVLLRRHDAPASADMKRLVALEQHNTRLKEEGYNDEERTALMDSLSHLIYVRMKMAKYFSLDDLVSSKFQSQTSSDIDRQKILDATWHFGLSVPLYTHFTSPIRRYADLLVHRQLGAILAGDHLISLTSKSDLIQQLHRFNYKAPWSSRFRPLNRIGEETAFVPSQLATQADWCNHRRMMSRRAQEASQRLFLTACLRDCGGLELYATVIDISISSIKLSLPGIGIIISVRLKQFLKNVTNWEVVSTPNSNEPKKNERSPTLRIEWTPTDAKIAADPQADCSQSPASFVREVSVLSVVPCRVYCLEDRLSLHADFLTSSPVVLNSAIPGRIISHSPCS